MGEIWRADPEIDAVICATDRIALGAMNFLREAGRSIPGDVSVAGFGDNFVSGFTSPPITTVRFRYRDSGLIAGRKILEEIAAAPEKSAPEDIRLGFELLRRGSV